MPERLFERLYRETATMNWQPTEVIRSRGRQRALRQRAGAVASTAAAVLLLAAGTAVLVWRPAAAPVPPGGPTSATPLSIPASPSASPSSVAPPAVLKSVPVSAMLQAADTGITSAQDEPRGAEDWQLWWLLGYCPTRVTNLFDHPPIGDRQRLFTANSDSFVLQSVQAYAAGEAEAALAAWTSAVAECPRFEFQGTVTVTILARNFTGDESILVETTTRSGRSLYALVREGTLLTEILARPADQATSDALARKAARRLCPVANSC